MKIFTLALLLSIIPVASAKNIQLKISSIWEKGSDTQILDTKVMAKLGSEWSIPFEGKSEYMLRIVATDNFNEPRELSKSSNQAIKLDGKIIKIEDGIEKVVSGAIIITRIGNEATMIKQSDDGEFLELTILPDWIQ